MSCSEMIVRAETPVDLDDINHLHEEAFGPGRFAKTAYRMREGVAPEQKLSLVAADGGRLVGAIRFTRVSIGGRAGALLLGPLAVYKDYSGHQCGLRLINKGLQAATEEGFKLVLLVGDLPYYQRAGFKVVPPGQILLPGPVNYQRLLVVELQDGALSRYTGMVTAG